MRTRRIGQIALLLLCAALICGTAVVMGGLASGYRPIVIQTGSMGETAPPGSLVIARPKTAADVTVGDVLVMETEGKATVTHRVIEIELSGDARFAVTQGDANEEPDARPFVLTGEHLVGRWYLPGWGRRLESAAQPGVALGIVVVALGAIAATVLRRIWSSPGAEENLVGDGAPTRPADRVDVALRRKRLHRRHMALAAVPLTMALTVGVSWAMLRVDESVGANVFGTRDCFDPQLGSVQSGETIHTVDGPVTVAIDAVDPTTSFVMASVRSASNESADVSASVRLTGGGTAVEIDRATDAGTPPPIVVAWSVVEYPCGVSVQRGVVNGSGGPTVDLTVADAPLNRSFVLASSRAERGGTDFDGDDLTIADLTSATNLRIRSGANLDTARSFAWQIVTFDDPGDLTVQHLDATLTGPSTTVAVPAPADPGSTFLLASVATSGGGVDIGARMIRAHLSSATTVEVTRQRGGEDLEVHVQVVTLKDGSTVRHGTVDFGIAQPARAVDIEPIDTERSTAISSVAVPGPNAGGSTDMAADDIVGEASATFVIDDANTIAVTRAASSAAASFGWQVIEWAGPRWWDPNYTFRQRIDVETDAAAAPGGYTVPIEVDHDALVAAGLALADGDDVRVLRWDGTNWSELDRILDDGSDWTTTDTTLLFRTVDLIDANTTDSYWLYFGNPAAGTPPTDPENVFALVEDFDDGDLGDFEDRTTGTAWYDAAPWTYRRSLTINSTLVPSPQSDYALLVQIADPGLGAVSQPDGSDIRFTAADGTTLLAYEIESWDPGTGSLTAWVRVPVVSASADTTLFLYGGAADAPAAESPRAVWGERFDALFHLHGDPTGTAPQVRDSGPRSADGLSRSTMTSADAVAGIAGGAIDFDGIDDGIDAAATPIGASGRFTISAWVRPDGFAGDAGVVSFMNGTMDVAAVYLEPDTTSIANPFAIAELNGQLIAAPGPPVTAGSWHHLVATYDGAALTLWVDGIAGAPTPANGIVTQSANPLGIGNRGPGGSAVPFDGLIDEVRIAQSAWTADTIATHYANLTDPMFVLESPPETGSELEQGTWSYRKPLTIEAATVSGSPADQAVFVAIDDPDLAAKARTDAHDVVFTAGDGVTRLDHVVESFDSGTGSLRAWVSVPALSSSGDTALFVYYGNPIATDQQDAIAVFGPDADLALLLN